jgi:hypothetical protein
MSLGCPLHPRLRIYRRDAANRRFRSFAVDGIAQVLIQAPKLESRIMRYELSDNCYNRFVRGKRAGIWDQVMEMQAALTMSQ